MMRQTRTTQRGIGLLAAAALTMAIAGCGSDDDEASAQEQYCEAGVALRSSVASLTNVNLVSEGTSGLQDALSAVSDDLSDLRDAADTAVESDVEALENAVDDLGSSVSDLSGDISRENASALGAAIEEVANSAQAVFATLGDC